jgi:hypothetical protein
MWVGRRNVKKERKRERKRKEGDIIARGPCMGIALWPQNLRTALVACSHERQHYTLRERGWPAVAVDGRTRVKGHVWYPTG